MFPPAYLRWVTHGSPLPALWTHGCRALASADWLSCFYGPRSLTGGAIHYHRISLALLGRVTVAPRRICGQRARAARATGTFGFMARPHDLLTTPIFSAGQSRPSAHICTVRTSPIVPRLVGRALCHDLSSAVLLFTDPSASLFSSRTHSRPHTHLRNVYANANVYRGAITAAHMADRHESSGWRPIVVPPASSIARGRWASRQC